MTVDDPKLYARIKAKVFAKYKKNSAYRSGQLVQEYKKAGGTYSGVKPMGGISRWFKENWKDVNPDKTRTSYPVFRPTKRISAMTPLTVSEISKRNIKKQAQLKQRLKGTFNLPPFLPIKNK